MRHRTAGAQSELEEKLRGIMKTDEWRVRRMARGYHEPTHCQALKGDEAGAKPNRDALIGKAMESETGKPCEFLCTLIDKWVAVDGNPESGQTIIVRDG